MNSQPLVTMHLQPSGRLQRQDRLAHKGEFDAVFKRGRRAHGPHLHVVARILPDRPTRPLLGLAIARGVGHAPARARLRRLTREAFRALRPLLQKPVALIVSARQPWPHAQLADVLAEMALLIRQLHLTP